MHHVLDHPKDCNICAPKTPMKGFSSHTLTVRKKLLYPATLHQLRVRGFVWPNGTASGLSGSGTINRHRSSHFGNKITRPDFPNTCPYFQQHWKACRETKLKVTEGGGDASFKDLWVRRFPLSFSSEVHSLAQHRAGHAEHCRQHHLQHTWKYIPSKLMAQLINARARV